jgi:TRAP-type transport system periplasmic protein
MSERSSRPGGTRAGIRVIALVVGLSFFAAACGGGPATTQAPAGQGQPRRPGPAGASAIAWDYAIFVGPTHPIGAYAQEFADRVKQSTGGRLVVTVRPSGELPYKPNDFVKVVGNGRVQLADGYTGFIAGDSKVAALPGVPFLVSTDEEMKKVYPVLKPHLERDLGRFGVGVLYWYDWPPQTLWGRGPVIQSPADFRGRKIRTTSPEQAEFVQRMGASPVTFTTPEVATALQRGTMDAVLTAGFNALGSQWGEFLNWGYTVGVNAAPSYVLVNQKALDDLPADVRAGLSTAADETQAKMLAEIPQREAADQQTLADKFNVNLFPPSPQDAQQYTETMRPYWDEWAKQAGADAEAALRDVRAALGK